MAKHSYGWSSPDPAQTRRYLEELRRLHSMRKLPDTPPPFGGRQMSDAGQQMPPNLWEDEENSTTAQTDQESDPRQKHRAERASSWTLPGGQQNAPLEAASARQESAAQKWPAEQEDAPGSPGEMATVSGHASVSHPSDTSDRADVANGSLLPDGNESMMPEDEAVQRGTRPQEAVRHQNAPQQDTPAQRSGRMWQGTAEDEKMPGGQQSAPRQKSTDQDEPPDRTAVPERNDGTAEQRALFDAVLREATGGWEDPPESALPQDDAPALSEEAPSAALPAPGEVAPGEPFADPLTGEDVRDAPADGDPPPVPDPRPGAQLQGIHARNQGVRPIPETNQIDTFSDTEEIKNLFGQLRQGALPAQRTTTCCTPQSEDFLTNAAGIPLCSGLDSLTYCENGPVLLRDSWLLEKLRRLAFAPPDGPTRGEVAGAWGEFVCSRGMGEYLCADFLGSVGRSTPVLVRFSTLQGLDGGALSGSGVMETKFYTGQGNYDLICWSVPVAPVSDAIRLPDLIAAAAPCPSCGYPQPARFWDYFSQSPELLNAVCYLYSGSSHPADYRQMDSWCPATFQWLSRRGRSQLVRLKWISRQGRRTLPRQELAEQRIRQPHALPQALRSALQSGMPVQYDLAVQLMSPQTTRSLEFAAEDATKRWPEERFPSIIIGTLTLSTPVQSSAELRESVFEPGNLLPGMMQAEDRLLAGWQYLAGETAVSRLGIDYPLAPVNRPLSRTVQDGTVNYYPSSGRLDGREPLPACPPPMPIYSAPSMTRQGLRLQDPYTQAGELFDSLSSAEQAAVCRRIAEELGEIPEELLPLVLEQFLGASVNWLRGVEEALGSCCGADRPAGESTL